MNVAYLRVSTEKQHVINQREEIIRYANEHNLVIDRWEMEVVSGSRKKEDRHLGYLLKSLKSGDILIVTELSRLSRSLYEIMNILNHCLEHHITLYSTKDGYAFDNSINSKVLAFAFGLVAEIERNLISLRTREALANRRNSGVKLGRPAYYHPKYELLCAKMPLIKQQLEAGWSVSEICRTHGIARSTFYKYRERTQEKSIESSSSEKNLKRKILRDKIV